MLAGGIIAQLTSLMFFLNRFLMQFNYDALRSHFGIICHIVLNLFLMLSVFAFSKLDILGRMNKSKFNDSAFMCGNIVVAFL